MTKSLLRIFPGFGENNSCKKFNAVIMQAREHVNSNMAQHTEYMFNEYKLWEGLDIACSLLKVPSF